MHGLVFAELKKYVRQKLGPGAWEELLVQANLGSKIYLTVGAYPDADIQAILQAGVKKTGLAAPVILEDFGIFLAPTLMSMYASLVRPEWKTMDLLEHVESVMHKAVRAQTAEAAPPELLFVRTGPKAITLIYRSRRRMCGLAKGIMKGVASHYKEAIQIKEVSCMHQGALECKMLITCV